MRKRFIQAGAVVMLGGGLGLISAQSNATYKGEIMDSACAASGSHEGMMKEHPAMKTAKECTLGCVKNGAKFVLYDAASKTTYQLDDQNKPRQYAGQNVTVTGKLDSSNNTIHVQKISGS